MGNNYKILACLGMPRSGSTVQYNLVKDVCAQEFRTKELGFLEWEFLEETIKEERFDGTIIFKSHWLDPDWIINQGSEIAIFLTHRNLIDVYISGIAKFGWSKETFYDEVDRSLSLYDQLSNLQGAFQSEFNDLRTNTIGEINRISGHLGYSLDEETIGKIGENWSISTSINRIKSLPLKVRINARITSFFRRWTPSALKRLLKSVGISYAIKKWILGESKGQVGSMLLPDHISSPKKISKIKQEVDGVLISEINKRYQNYMNHHAYN